MAVIDLRRQQQNPWEQLLPNLVQMYAKGLMMRELQGEKEPEEYNLAPNVKRMRGSEEIARGIDTSTASGRKLGDTRKFPQGAYTHTEEWTNNGWKNIAKAPRKLGMSLEDRLVYNKEMSRIEQESRTIRKQVFDIQNKPDLDIYTKQKALIPEMQKRLKSLEGEATELRKVSANMSNRLKPKPTAKQPEVSKEMADMPPPAQHAGKIIKDTVTGKRYKSNGTSWEEIK